MTRFSKFLSALLLGLALSTAPGCPDNPDQGANDLSSAPQDGSIDLQKKD